MRNDEAEKIIGDDFNVSAAASVGINVFKMRCAGVLISGLWGGLEVIFFITVGTVLKKFPCT